MYTIVGKCFMPNWSPAHSYNLQAILHIRVSSEVRVSFLDSTFSGVLSHANVVNSLVLKTFRPSRWVCLFSRSCDLTCFSNETRISRWLPGITVRLYCLCIMDPRWQNLLQLPLSRFRLPCRLHGVLLCMSILKYCQRLYQNWLLVKYSSRTLMGLVKRYEFGSGTAGCVLLSFTY